MDGIQRHFFRCVPLFENDQKFFDLTSYFPQKRTLWPGQSLSSPIRRRFFDPPNGAIRWMYQYVCILCVHLFNLSHSVHLLHLPHSIPVNCQKMVRNAYLFWWISCVCQHLKIVWESSKSDPANFGTITRHTFPLALTQKVNKCDHFL